jgi:hypothetical protein
MPPSGTRSLVPLSRRAADPLTVRHPTCTLAAACRVGVKQRRCDGHGVITHFGAQRPLGQSAKKKGSANGQIPRACLCSRAYRRKPLPSTLAPTRTRRLAFPMSKRFCRKWMDQGDFTVLACLKENRTRLHQAWLDALIRQRPRRFVRHCMIARTPETHLFFD